jgi:hypothetical protein
MTSQQQAIFDKMKTDMPSTHEFLSHYLKESYIIVDDSNEIFDSNDLALKAIDEIGNEFYRDIVRSNQE